VGAVVRVAVNPMARPATITPTQMRSDSVATTFAARGVAPDASQRAIVFRAVSSKTSMFTAASTSRIILARKNVLWK